MERLPASTTHWVDFSGVAQVRLKRSPYDRWGVIQALVENEKVLKKTSVFSCICSMLSGLRLGMAELVLRRDFGVTLSRASLRGHGHCALLGLSNCGPFCSSESVEAPTTVRARTKNLASVNQNHHRMFAITDCGLPVLIGEFGRESERVLSRTHPEEKFIAGIRAARQ